MPTLKELEELEEIRSEYRSYDLRKKQELSYLLVKDGFIKGDSPLLRLWWQSERNFMPHYSLTVAMDDYVHKHPEVLYLEDFNPERLKLYDGVGETKVTHMKRRKERSLTQYYKKNGDKQ